MALWLDTVFHGFDFAVLSALHSFAQSTGDGFGWFFRLISAITLDGFGLLIPGFVLLFFKRTRKLGAVMFGAVVFGAVITNLTLKPLVDRARPFTHEEIAAWWRFVGAVRETEGSFPSGHTTAATAAATGFFLAFRKKYAWPALLFIPVMGLSRLYLMVHYPTDILGGVLSGVAGALLALLCVSLIWRVLEKYKTARFPRFVLEFDPVIACVGRVKAKKEAPAEDPAGERETEAPAGETAESSGGETSAGAEQSDDLP